MGFHRELEQLLRTCNAMNPEIIAVKPSAVGSTEAPAKAKAKSHVDKEKEVRPVDDSPQSVMVVREEPATEEEARPRSRR